MSNLGRRLELREREREKKNNSGQTCGVTDPALDLAAERSPFPCQHNHPLQSLQRVKSILITKANS